jgi:hypothetical protein
MKHTTLAVLLAFSSLTVGASFAGETAEPKKVETKKVCIKQMNPKTKKEKKVCKNVKQHKKLEGTPVPKK